MTRAYANFRLPIWTKSDDRPHTTLVEQSEVLSRVMPAADDPSIVLKRLTTAQRDQAVLRFKASQSLTAIARDLGIAWNSVARLLDQAGARPMSSPKRFEGRVR